MSPKRKTDIIILSDLITEPITFVDVGARGGVIELRNIAKYVKAIGVEPNPLEKELILSGHYEKDKRGYWAKPKYLQLNYYWGAITKSSSSIDLFITSHPGASGIKTPNYENLDFKYKLNMTSKEIKNSFNESFVIKKTINVPSISIDQLMSDFDITHIDYLKIDVEGNEYEVLESVSEISKKVSLIRVEVCFLQFRNSQKLFDDVFKLLINAGFSFITFRDIQKGYKSKLNSNYWNERYGFKNIEATWMSADAYFVRYPEVKELRYKLSLILCSKGFMDQALICIKDDVETYENILKTQDKHLIIWIIPLLLDILNKFKFTIVLKKLIKKLLGKGN